VLSNEQIRNEQLSVIETNETHGFAIAQIMHKSSRYRSIWESDTLLTSYTGAFAMDIAKDFLRISYQGFEDYDVVIEMNDLVRNTVNGDQRYVIYNSRASTFRNIITDGRLQIGLTESRVYWGSTTQETTGMYDTNRTYSLRKSPKSYDFRPTMRYRTSHAAFRKILNKCKTGTFCIITRDNKIGVFANQEGEPTVHSLATDGQEFTDALAAVDYLTIYNSLYRRKQSDLGLMNRLSMIGDFDITEFGIVDNRVYVRISGEGFTATFTYHAIDYDIPEVEIPVNTKRRRGRTQVEEVIPDPVEVWQETLTEISESDEVVWTTEEEDRLILWQDAHAMWCNNRNQERSNSRALWFSHYSMALIRNGEAPDELDIEIMSKV